jgi:hypothetical protein
MVVNILVSRIVSRLTLQAARAWCGSVWYFVYLRDNRVMLSVEASLLIRSQIGAHRYQEGHQLEVW